MSPARTAIVVAIAAALLQQARPASAMILDPSFEAGFGAWDVDGSAAIVDVTFGIPPTHGDLQAILDTGSNAKNRQAIENAMGLPSGAIADVFDTYVAPSSTGTEPTQTSAMQQTFTADAGDMVSFDFDFLTNQVVPEDEFTDFAWAIIQLDGNVVDSYLIADAGQPVSDFGGGAVGGYDYSTGTQTFTFTMPLTGTYTVTFGVSDVTDNHGDSAIVFDNFVLSKVPEPGTFTLLALGLMVLHAHARRGATRRRQPEVSGAPARP